MSSMLPGPSPDEFRDESMRQARSDAREVQQSVDFAAEAAARFPWLTGRLLDQYAEFWEETGNASTALTKLRNTNLYSKKFAGIRRDDGTLRMDENQYLSTLTGYSETLAEFGVDPAEWSGKFSDLIELEVGADEFYRTVGQGFQRFREPGTDDNRLLNDYINEFTSTGSAELALEAVRNSDAYDDVFAGNRRDDGSLRMDEPEYFAYQRGFDRMFTSRGLNPEVFRGKGRLVDAIEAEVSIQELDNRLSAIEDNVLGNRAEVGEFFRDAYGEGYADGIPTENTRAAVLAMAIDPDVGNDILTNRISAAQIGGEAAVQGYARSVERAEELARAGLSQGNARQLYSDAASRLSGLSATTRRFNRGGTSLAQFEDAFAMGAADEQQRLSRALQSEQSSFSATQDTLRDRDGFGLRGLRQR